MVTRSFGRPDPAEDNKTEEQQPVPVLHVGEVHAELRLTVSDQTLRDLGSQIASMFARAAKEGFEHGLAAAMDQFEDDDTTSGEAGGAQPRARGVHLDLSDPTPVGDVHLSDKDIERLGRVR